MGNQEVFVFTGGPPPNWLEKHSWFAPVQVAPAETMPMVGLKKIDLKVDMCCMKCAEIVSEEIREVPGVLDVQIDYVIKKVTVIGNPYMPDVLRRARKVDKKADYWPPPPPPPPPPEPTPEPTCIHPDCQICKPPPKEEPKEEPKKEEEKKEEPKKEEEKKEEKKEEEKKEEKKEEEKKEEEKKEEEKKEEKKEEEKKEEKKEEEKPKEEPPPAAAQAVVYPPYEYMVSRFPSYDYHPSQSYNPLLPHQPFPYSRQIYFDWPHFRTAEAGAEAAFVPSPKPVPYESVGDFFSIFQSP